MSEEVANPFEPIRVRDLFREKSPRLAKMIPGFVYRYITKIMHLDEINDILSNYGHLRGIDFVEEVVRYFNVTREITGLENISPDGRYIFVSNHPLGGFDSLLLMSSVYGKCGELRFLVNDILMQLAPLRPIFVPIDKYGANGREAALQLREEYLSDRQILIFPSGLASRRTRGEITDTVWKKHFIQKAVEFRRDVVPVHISGRNSNFFYNLANIRKALRIKWNLEIFFLPDETFRHRNNKFTLTFGNPLSYTTFDKSKTAQEWANDVREVVYSLPFRSAVPKNKG